MERPTSLQKQRYTLPATSGMAPPNSHSTAVARNPLLLFSSEAALHVSPTRPSRRLEEVIPRAQPSRRRTPWPCGRERAPTPAPALCVQAAVPCPGDRKPRPTPMSTLFQAETAGCPETGMTGRQSYVDIRPEQREEKSKRRQTGSIVAPPVGAEHESLSSETLIPLSHCLSLVFVSLAWDR
jgi:hypothetical protein